MGYKAVPEDGGVGVYKTDAAGNAVGGCVGKHGSMDEANAQMDALSTNQSRRSILKTMGSTKAKKKKWGSGYKSYTFATNGLPDGFEIGTQVKVDMGDGSNQVGKIDGFTGGQFWICLSNQLYIYAPESMVTRIDVPQKSMTLGPDDMLISMGSAVKAMGGGRIGGHLVLFGAPDVKDFYGDYFDDKTYLGPGNGDGRDVTINHRLAVKTGMPEMDRVMQLFTEKLFKPGGLKAQKDAVGIFGEVMCDLSDAYEQMVYELADRGKLKWSSGAARHLIDRDHSTGRLKMFVISEGALTPIPAEPRMLNSRVVPLKALQDSFGRS